MTDGRAPLDLLGLGSHGWMIGAALILVGAVGLGRRLVFVVGSRRAAATVVRWSVGKARSMFVRLDDGTERRVANAGRALAPVGATIEVLVHRRWPQTVLRPGLWDLVGPAAIATITGAALVVIPALLR